MASLEALPNHRIHGIRFLHGNQRHCLVFGSKFINELRLRWDDADDTLLSVEIVRSLGPFNDWIKDVSVLSIEDATIQEQSCSYSLAIVFAHNYIECWSISHDSHLTLKHHVQCSAKNILYSARIKPQSVSCWHDLEIAVGTVFNQVLIWRPANVDENGDARVVQSFSGHEGVIFSLRYSPTGDAVVSVSDDRSIRIWSLIDAG